MAEKKTISARAMVEDIRAGMTDEQLLLKHGLSGKGLQSLKSRLITAGLLTAQELDGKFSPTQVTDPSVNKRAFAKSVADAVKNGLPNSEIVKRFGISAAKLPKAYESLIKAGYLTQEDLNGRGNEEAFEQTVDIASDVVDTVPKSNRSGTPLTQLIDAPGPAELLLYAAKTGDVNRAGDLLRKGIDVNCRDRDGNTPLILASRSGHPDVVRLLLGKGADPKLKNSFFRDALESALAGGYQEIGELLKSGISGTKGPVEAVRTNTNAKKESRTNFAFTNAPARGMCWFCETRLADDSSVPIRWAWSSLKTTVLADYGYKKVIRDDSRRDSGRLVVPACSECRIAHVRSVTNLPASIFLTLMWLLLFFVIAAGLGTIVKGWSMMHKESINSWTDFGILGLLLLSAVLGSHLYGKRLDIVQRICLPRWTKLWSSFYKYLATQGVPGVGGPGTLRFSEDTQALPSQWFSALSRLADKVAGPGGIPWYDRKWVVALVCLLCFPIGFYALHYNSNLSNNSKWLLGILGVVTFILLGIVKGVLEGRF